MTFSDITLPQSIDASKDTATRTSKHLDDENTRPNDIPSINGGREDACGGSDSAQGNLASGAMVVSLPSGRPRSSVHGNQSTIALAAMISGNPQPQPKRRKITPQPDNSETKKQGKLLWGQGASLSSDSGLSLTESAQDDPPSASSTIPTSQIQPDKVERVKESVPRPKKNMKLSADGHLASPPKKEVSIGKVKGRRKPGLPKKQQLVVIKYGSDQTSKREIGEKIDKILHGELRIKPFKASLSNGGVKSIQTAPATGPPKSTHPFFLAQSNQDLQLPRPPLPSRCTNGISQTPVSDIQSNSAGVRASHVPLFGAAAPRSSYPPNSKDSLWPPEGLFHVRNLSPSLDLGARLRARPLQTSQKKCKKLQLVLNPNQDVLSHLVTLVSDSGLSNQSLVTDTLSKPKRHITFRSRIPELISQQLTQHHQQRTSSEDSGRGLGSNTMKFTSGASERLFETLATASSAFDEFRCEHQQWTHKYSPKSTTEILQPQEEMQLLKNWLLGSSVHTTTITKNTLPVPKRKSLKKRKQRAELDDFIATSEDEENPELPNARTNSNPDNKQSYLETHLSNLTRHSLLRSFTDYNSKLTKAVIISGPPGCGKSSAVHAIARELEFEIFEINPGSRRSGRDILEKVGDMTKNHLVSQGPIRSKDENDGNNDILSGTDQALDVIDLREEIATGKQSTMQSFFKSKTVNKPRKKKSVVPLQASKIKSDAEAEGKKSNKPQKQSLILLEEVDILFEEDKQFWSTIIALITTSKRPIIMTCNDDSLLPVDELVDCSILRMRPPPDDMAVDYLLLLATHEGHLLEKKAIKGLYQRNGSDLRASIMQMNTWCQMAIGDPTGGLDWMLLPQDYNNINSEVLQRRVLSEGTLDSYAENLGPNQSSVAADTESYMQRWHDETYESGFPAKDFGPFIVESAQDESTRTTTWHDQLVSLDLMYETLSSYDIQSYTLESHTAQESLFLPLLSDHRRDNLYTNNPPLLEVPDEGATSYLGSQHVSKLKDTALSILRKSTDHGGSELDYAMCYQNLCGIKGSSSTHQAFITEALAVALDPVTKLSDQSLRTICMDVAPYIRSIISYDLQLEHERARLNDLLSDSSRQGKRQRTTRASRAALEGGHKSSTRRERWFPVDLDSSLIMRTGGQDWQEIAQKQYTAASRRQRWVQQTEQSDSEDELCQ